jgi:hypothetical protein
MQIGLRGLPFTLRDGIGTLFLEPFDKWWLAETMTLNNFKTMISLEKSCSTQLFGCCEKHAFIEAKSVVVFKIDRANTILNLFAEYVR